MTDRYSSFERGSTRWLLQRVTAAFLVVVLAFHFFQLHFLNHAYEVTFAGTRARMQQPAYFLTMVAFLLAATFHGVNGVYNSLVNLGVDGVQETAIRYALVAAGIALVVQGIRVATVMAGVSIG